MSPSVTDLLKSATALYALTLQQPWAFAVAELGKDRENRGWEPPPARVGQLLAVHAGQAYDMAGAASIHNVLGLRVPGRHTCVKGAVVAVAVLARAERASTSRWAIPGQVHWVLEGTVRLEQPVAAKGAQGLWLLPGTKLEEVRRQVLATVDMSRALLAASPTEEPPTGLQKYLAEATAATRLSLRTWSKGSARGAGPGQSTGAVRVGVRQPPRLCEKCGCSRPAGDGPHAARLMREEKPGWPECKHGRRYLADCRWEPAGPQYCCQGVAHE